MNYKENIKYRETIEGKAYKSEKMSSEEKWWCISNPMFNPKYDFPCYVRDAISVPKDKKIKVTIEVLDFDKTPNVYRPVIGIIGNGEILVDFDLVTYSGKKAKCRKTKILIPLVDREYRTETFELFSIDGLVSIAYQCEYYDKFMKLYKREISDGAYLAYGMKKQVLSENRYIYFCKNPKAQNDDFNSFVFMVNFEFND